MATRKPKFEIAGKNGHCADCYGQIRRGELEYRYFLYGRRVRHHVACANKTVLRELPPSFAR